MIIYNVTIIIDDSVHDDWLNWMKTVHIPDVMKTAKFINNKICRVLDAEEEGGKTYAIQYTSKNKADYDDYQENHAKDLQAEHINRYAGKFGAFRTILEVVHEQ
ncbi:MAG: hypothetical protein ACJAUV_000645 [Flavobacteriales bacterium]|jgi:uncharacterized protein YqfB (UPF0267 family)